MTATATTTTTTPSCVLITGANVGLGFECARQLALVEGIQKILLACRNIEKATAAKERLEEELIHSNNNKTIIFDIVIIDVSNLASVRDAVEKIKNDETIVLIDGIVLNAGGAGGPEPKSTLR